MNAIVLVVDRLHAGYLGAYGNAWVETPALDSENLPVDLLGGLQPAALMVPDRHRQCFRNRWHG